MPDSTEATSPALNGDANSASESGNLSIGQASALLFKNAEVKPKESEATAESAATSSPPEQEAAAESTETESVETQTPETEPAESPTEETTAEPEADTEETDALSKQPLDPKTRDRIQKRIDKEVGRRKQLEAKLNELESILREKETAQPEQKPSIVVPDNVPPHIAALNSLESVAKMRQDAKTAIRWAEEKLDAINDGEPAPEGWDRQTLKQSLRQAKIALEDHLPQREQFLQTRERTRQVAYQEFPFLRDRTTPEYQMAQAALREPWLQSLPNAEWIAGVQIEGLKAIEARKQAAKTKAEADAKPKAPKIVPAKPSNAQAAVTSSGTATRAPGAAERSQLSAERARLNDKGAVTTAEAVELMKRSELNRKR
jgi:hypothetical protein